MLLDAINSPEDVKNLSREELDLLANELREFIISSVSKTGGHLASNLGVIELTLALCQTFDFPEDKVIWDVGHQSYTYKILTGRKDQFAHLRQWDGMAGFPKTEESIYDSFNTGHSSTSISAALGMLRGMNQQGEKHHVIAVIGDGAMTGGMAFEALNDAGSGDDQLIVIINDNQMSISENVGGMQGHLNRLRTSHSYLNLKGKFWNFLQKVPGFGSGLANFLAKIKNWFRKKLGTGENAMFESLGFRYYGPIDGHNMDDLRRTMMAAKNCDEPVLIHVCTVKGYGYKYAENAPENYHGVAPFEVELGVPIAAEGIKERTTGKLEDEIIHASSFTKAFSLSLQYLAIRNPKILGICAAMAGGTGMDDFGKLFPHRFYDVGIAEQHAVTMSAGMAMVGMRPVVAIYSTFMQRALDQVIHDVCLQKLPVVFCIDRTGVVGEDGETHQGLYELAFLKTLPNARVFSPRDYEELFKMMTYASQQEEGPIFIRYPKGKTLLTTDDRMDIKNFLKESECTNNTFAKAQYIREGKDFVFIAHGYGTGVAYRAASLLAEDKIQAAVIDVSQVYPLDRTFVDSLDDRTIVVIEEARYPGSLTQDVSSLLFELGKTNRMDSIHIKEDIVQQGKRDLVLEHLGITVDHVIKRTKELMK